MDEGVTGLVELSSNFLRSKLIKETPEMKCIYGHNFCTAPLPFIPTFGRGEKGEEEKGSKIKCDNITHIKKTENEFISQGLHQW